jgi:hypothetical protein
MIIGIFYIVEGIMLLVHSFGMPSQTPGAV